VDETTWRERVKTTKQKESGFSVMATSPLSRREEELFNLLRETLPNHIILTQVDIKRVLDFKSGDRQKYDPAPFL